MNNKYKREIVLWEIIFPLFIYYFLHLIIMIIARDFIGAGSENYMLCQIIADIVTIPVIYFLIYRKSKNIFRAYDPDTKTRIIDLAVIIVMFALISFGLNNVIVMSPLVDMSAGYAQANEGFYGSLLGIELVGSGILAPLLEELVFRGIVYGSLRKLLGVWQSVVISALIFAAVHFNIVQFVYAFIVGIVLAITMECIGNVYGAIVGHMTANIFAVIRTELGLFSGMTDKSLSAWCISLGILFCGAAVLIMWQKRQGNLYQK